MVDTFYRAFEERYRGSREVIKSRLRQYLPFVEPLASKYPDASVFDVGCGRGEWLELMAEIGLVPHGIDLDDGMIVACVELGLPAQKGDAITFLSTLPNDSQLVVSAFHVIEHISFEQLRILVREALRVLKCGGILIMETPNPENIIVATRNFYLDPTHQRLIPPQLLSFLSEYYGFEQVKTLRLQESAELAAGKPLSLLDVFNAVSPDFAVVAQKGGDEAAIAATKSAFDTEYGLTFEVLADKYEEQVAAKAQQLEELGRELNEQLESSRQEVQRLNESLAKREQEINFRHDKNRRSQDAGT
jgi:O-antigen chain-terminating methyltransferase